MGLAPVERKKKLDVYFSDEEYKIVTDRANKENITYSEYARLACLLSACYEGDTRAWKLTFKNASRKAKTFVGRMLSNWGLERAMKMNKTEQ